MAFGGLGCTLQYSGLSVGRKRLGRDLWCGSSWSLARGLLFSRSHQRVKHQQDAADHDAGVSHVEVGPVVVHDVDFQKVDDRAGADSIVHIADGPSKDQREAEGGCGDASADAEEHEPR